MAMLKAVGWGHKKPGKSSGDGTKDGRGRSNEELQDSLAFGDDVTKSQIKDYLEHGHGSVESRVRAFRSSPSLLADENSWAEAMRRTLFQKAGKPPSDVSRATPPPPRKRSRLVAARAIVSLNPQEVVKPIRPE